MVNSLVDATTKSTKVGFNRRAASTHDKDAWITVVSRLATRSLTGLQDAAQVKQENDNTHGPQPFSISQAIRDSLYIYILDDFRRRIDAAISWLNEEWYNDQLQIREGGNPVLHYDPLALKVLDGIVPYLDAKDSKVLIRFLSEIPGINLDILERVKGLARDPERVSLAVNAIQ